ncbi:MAG TPA: transcriptional regulator, partial [Spirochaetales bacterium]|nr:transcriptional regulator [Spirochaetales bacterium]
RRLAEAFAKCGLVERSGQGMNRIFESCIRESKGDPDFSHTDDKNFWLTLHGTIQQPEFLRVLEKIGSERLLSFTTEDFIVIQSVYTNRPIPERYTPVITRLLEEGLLERSATKSKAPWILGRKLYSSINKAGVHTRKAGLDREQNKELIFKHIQRSEPQGATMEEFLQVLPAFDRSKLQALLRSLVHEGRIEVRGVKKGARWYLRQGKPNDAK